MSYRTVPRDNPENARQKGVNGRPNWQGRWGLLCLAVRLWAAEEQVKVDAHMALMPTSLIPGLNTAAVPSPRQETYSHLPLSFEPNLGQTDARVQFWSRGPGYAVFLAPTEMVLAMQRPQAAVAAMLPHAPSLLPRGRTAENRVQSEKASATVWRMKLIGANPTPQIVGVEELPGKVNYFIGNDPTQWRINVSTYAKVRYQDVYPGVDLIFYGNQRYLEYDFIVAPGVASHTLTLAFEGADTLEVDTQGDLVLYTAGGHIRQRKPVIYQEVEGVRREISGGYVLTGPFQVGFQVAEYDATKPLVIDPGLDYSTYLGGFGAENGEGIAVDSMGNVYVTGFATTNFPTTSGAFQTTFGGLADAFVTKLNATGTALLYSTYLGGNGTDAASGIALDSAGNAYLTAGTISTNFPTTPGAFQTTSGGLADAFITKLNATGTALLYSTYLGGNALDWASGIALDGAGNAYITGFTVNPTGVANNFPTTANALQATYGGGGCSQPGINQPGPRPFRTFGGCGDAFVAKLNAAGALLYSTYLGGNGDDGGNAIAVDGSGNGYVTGFSFSPNFPTTLGTFQTNFVGGLDDAFVAKFSFGATDLSVTMTASPEDVTVGDDLTYTIVITNNGPDTATGVILTDMLPADAMFLSATPSQGNCTHATGTVTCSLESLANGATATVTVVITPTTVGTITNTATVTGNESDPVTANNTATQNTHVALQYAVKFICGKSAGDAVAPGTYFTAINVHNSTNKMISLRKKFAVALPEEKPGPVSPFFDAKLGADEALEIDCRDIFTRSQLTADFLKGFVVIRSATELDVVAVYTAAGATGQIETLETERVSPLQRVVKPSRLPDLVPVKPFTTPGPAGFCRLNSQGQLLVSVKNQGSADAPASTTTVDFFPGGSFQLPTPAISASGSVDLLPLSIPEACFTPNCLFRLTVDVTNQINESNESNNSADGMCLRAG